jgi:16S rRNA (guanine966-N2)-methyltransferase
MSLKIIGGLFRGRKLHSPAGDQTRPTTSLVRAAVFNICQEWIPNARFLDLFAGSGAMSLEALSRGAAFATLIENTPPALAAIRANISLLQLEPQTQLLALDVHLALPKLLSPYDLIYIDPPYEYPTTSLLDTLASLNLLAPRGLLFLEERYNPKSAPHVPPTLTLTHSRRYGIAHLHQYRHSIL